MKGIWILAPFLAAALAPAQPPTRIDNDPRARGAVCDGVKDDTAALQATINAGGTILLPPLTCRVTSPLYMLTSNTSYTSLVGVGSSSVILADYSTWPAEDNAVIEINSSPGGTSSGQQTHGRRFSNFQIEAVKTGSHSAVGIKVASVNPAKAEALQSLTSAQASVAPGYLPTYNAQFEKIHFTGFTTAIEVDESWNVTLEDLHGVFNSNGIAVKGFAVGVHINSCNFGVPRGTGGTGVLIDGRTYSDSVFIAPQDVTVEGSTFVGFGTAANIKSGLQIRIQNSILDLSGSSTVLIGAGPNGVYLGPNNWIWTNSGTASAVSVANSSNSGLWIVKNNIGATRGASGINFASGASNWTGVTIEGNTIHGFTNPMNFNSMPQYSSIRDNHGYGNSGPFISLGGSGLSAAGLLIEGNTSKDALDIFRGGSAKGYATGYNASATQSIGLSIPSVTLGNSSTRLSRYARYAATLSPSAVGANTCAAQPVTVNGVQSGDFVIKVTKPTEQPGLALIGGRVTGSNTVTVQFCNNTAVPITPTASESYTFQVMQ